MENLCNLIENEIPLITACFSESAAALRCNSAAILATIANANHPKRTQHALEDIRQILMTEGERFHACIKKLQSENEPDELWVYPPSVEIELSLLGASVSEILPPLDDNSNAEAITRLGKVLNDIRPRLSKAIDLYTQDVIKNITYFEALEAVDMQTTTFVRTFK